MNTESIRTQRLTRKDGDCYFYEKPIAVIDGIVGVHYDSGKHIDKLGKLEDIEEELGIDLVTLFKALKSLVYYIDEDGNIVSTSVHLSYNKPTDRFYLEAGYVGSWIQDKEHGYWRTFDLDRYGITWALDRNELKKEGLK